MSLSSLLLLTAHPNLLLHNGRTDAQTRQLSEQLWHMETETNTITMM